jgi:DNA-binding transcriptional MerR regulator
MDTNQENTAGRGYPIGVVSRLTGIQPTTLRIWERRYGLVSPKRSGGRNRLYGDDDIRRLSLVKALIDAGHPVSSVALLDTKQLQSLLESSTEHRGTPVRQATRPRRIVVMGSGLPVRLKAQPELEVAGVFSNEAELLVGGKALAPEVLLIEYPTVHGDAPARIRTLLEASGARGAVLVYGFGPRQALADLAAESIICLRAPVNMAEVANACRSDSGRSVLPVAPGIADVSAPAPRFTPDQLARISDRAPSIACECPHHLVDLINSMAAFETYSRECEHKNAADAQIHAFLHKTAGHSRALLEAALQRVTEFEGIDVN